MIKNKIKVLRSTTELTRLRWVRDLSVEVHAHETEIASWGGRTLDHRIPSSELPDVKVEKDVEMRLTEYKYLTSLTILISPLKSQPSLHASASAPYTEKDHDNG